MSTTKSASGVIDELPESPDGELTMGQHRRKTNETIQRLNLLGELREVSITSDVDLFEISNDAEQSIPASTPIRIMPTLVTAKMAADATLDKYLIIDTENKQFSFKKDGLGESIIAFELTIHMVGDGNWSNASYISFKRSGLKAPIITGTSSTGQALNITASTGTYPLYFYDEKNQLVDIRDDNFYVEIFSDSAKTIPVKHFQFRIKFTVLKKAVVGTIDETKQTQ